MSPYRVVLGLDRLPSYFGFSGMIIDQSGILFKQEAMTKDDILEAVRLYKVEAVAIDNIYELGSDQEIKCFMSYLYKTDLIQTTGSPHHGFKPLSLIGKELGLTSGEKLSPLKSAEVNAKAVLLGHGYVVKLYDPETKVTISRRRSFGPGGMSAGRFKRSIQNAILSLTKSIESALRRKGIDYDLFFKRGSHGIESSSFIIYAPRNQLSGLVRPIRTSSVSVRVTPIFSKAFEFVPVGINVEQSQKRNLIVGVDPGMVCGLAVLDLNGRVLHVSSGRSLTRGHITRTISSFGRALIFASDVNPPPALILKLSSSHNAITFSPEQSLKTSEKQELVDKLIHEQKVEIGDSHQRDALAAALKAFSYYKNKLEQCVSHVKELGVRVDLDEVKAQVIRGASIKDAIASSKPKVLERSVQRKRRSSEREIINVLENKLVNIQSERDALLLKLKNLEERIEELELELKLTKRRERVQTGPETYEMERRIETILVELTRLRTELETEKTKKLQLISEMRSLASGESLIFNKFPTIKEALKFTRGAVVRRVEPLTDELKKELKRSPPEFVILQEVASLEAILDLEIPVILLSDLTFSDYDEFVIVNRNQFEIELEKSKKKLKDYSKEKARKIKAIFDQYRIERSKELNRA